MILKDKKYFGIYLAAIILEILVVLFSIFFVIFVIIKTNDFESSIKIVLSFFSVIVFLLSLFGLTLGNLSMHGYINIPNILIEINDDNIILNISKNESVTLFRNDIKEIYIDFKVFARSSYFIVIKTNTDTYLIKDVYKIKESYDKLIKWFN